VAIKVTGDPEDEKVSCVSGKYVQPDGTLGPTPEFRFASQWGSVVWVHDELIIPDASYLVQVDYGGAGLSTQQMTRTRVWGDVDGVPNEEGACGVDVGDILAVLDAFSNFPFGLIFQADHAPCDAEQVIDVADILAVIDAFTGVSFSDWCPMPCESGFMAPGGGQGAMGQGGAGPMGGGMATGTIRLERAQKTVAVGGLAGVHVFVSDVNELRGWQFALDSLAANGTVFAWEVLAVDDARTDYVFFGLDDFPATNMTQGRVAAALAAGGVSPSAERYLGTVWFRVTSLGGGSMTVSLDESHTQLRDSAGQSITVVNLGPVTINIIP
jgi:hypothetical protein